MGKINRPLPLQANDFSTAEQKSLLDRLDSMTVPHQQSECIHWTGNRDAKGYGKIKSRGKTWWVHRIVYALFVGPIPPAMSVHHKCSCTHCLNPDHLELATLSRNSKERHSRNPNRKRAAPPLDLPV